MPTFFIKGRSQIFRKLIKAIGIITLYFLSKIIFQRPIPEKIKKILIYSPTGIGDAILLTPALRRLRKSFPNANITIQFIGPPYGGQEILGESNLVNETSFFNTQTSGGERLKWVSRIKKGGYDLALVNLECRSLDVLYQIVLGRIPIRVGHTMEEIFGRDSLKHLFNYPVPVKPGHHEIELNNDLIRALGVDINKEDNETYFHIGEEAERRAKATLENSGIIDSNFICVQVGAASGVSAVKTWALEKFSLLLDNFISKTRMPVVILGDEYDTEKAYEIEADMKEGLNVLTGKTTIKETAAIIRKAKFLLCHDSGLMHVACAVRTPIIAIYGPTDYYRTKPLGKMDTVIRKELECSPCMYAFRKRELDIDCKKRECLASITVGEVLKVMLEKLEWGKV